MNPSHPKGIYTISAPDVIKERFYCCLRVSNHAAPVKSVASPFTRSQMTRTTEDPLVLAGTSEMFWRPSSVARRSKIYLKKYVAVSHCFRSEVGHHTADSRGLYWVHQFTKIELFVFVIRQTVQTISKKLPVSKPTSLMNWNFRIECWRWPDGNWAHRRQGNGTMKYGCRVVKFGVKLCQHPIVLIINPVD